MLLPRFVKVAVVMTEDGCTTRYTITMTEMQLLLLKNDDRDGVYLVNAIDPNR